MWVTALMLFSAGGAVAHKTLQPVGAGFSYGAKSSLRNSSERAAWDLDDFLQAFWV